MKFVTELEHHFCLVVPVFFQIHDEKPDPITEISVDILQLFTLWSKNSNFCHLFGNSQYINTNLTYNFFKFSESAVVVALAVKALPSILLLTRINVLCTILKNSTTLVSMRCPWMWPTSSKKKRKEVFFVKSISRKKNPSWPNDPSLIYVYTNRATLSTTTTTNLSKSLLLQARDDFEDFCFHEKKKNYWIEK